MHYYSFWEEDAFWSVTDNQGSGMDMQRKKSEYFLLFPVISPTSLLMVLPISCNPVLITDTVTGIHLENLTNSVHHMLCIILETMCLL